MMKVTKSTESPSMINDTEYLIRALNQDRTFMDKDGWLILSYQNAEFVCISESGQIELLGDSHITFPVVEVNIEIVVTRD